MARTTDRGYGAAHRTVKRQWQKILEDQGHVDCHAVTCLMPDRTIYDGDEWDLGHSADRTHWTGPEHPRCNRTEGATRGNKGRGNKPKPRRWAL